MNVDEENVRRVFAEGSQLYRTGSRETLTDNTRENVRGFMSSVADSAASWLKSTSENMALNQMYNDTSYLQGELDSRYNQVSGAAGKAKAQTWTLHEQVARAYVVMGWTQYVTFVLGWVAAGVALGCLLIVGVQNGIFPRTSLKPGFIAIGIVVLLVVLIRASINARRHDDSWRHFYWDSMQ